VGVGEKGKIPVTDANDECSVEELGKFQRVVVPYMAKLDSSASSEQFG